MFTFRRSIGWMLGIGSYCRRSSTAHESKFPEEKKTCFLKKNGDKFGDMTATSSIFHINNHVSCLLGTQAFHYKRFVPPWPFLKTPRSLSQPLVPDLPRPSPAPCRSALGGCPWYVFRKETWKLIHMFFIFGKNCLTIFKKLKKKHGSIYFFIHMAPSVFDFPLTDHSSLERNRPRKKGNNIPTP